MAVKKEKWLHKKCGEYVVGSGKCTIKVPTRYNDYCEKDDCPKRLSKFCMTIHFMAGLYYRACDPDIAHVTRGRNKKQGSFKRKDVNCGNCEQTKVYAGE